MRRVLRWSAALLALLLAAPLAYLLAALVLGLLPVNADWRPTPEERGGVPVYLRTNGVHADLVLPVQAPHDFTHLFPRAALIDLAREPSLLPFNWIAFGWGDRGFYLNTPTWADLDAVTAWRALTAQGPSAMHVEYLRRPEDYEVRLLWLSETCSRTSDAMRPARRCASTTPATSPPTRSTKAEAATARYSPATSGCGADWRRPASGPHAGRRSIGRCCGRPKA
ncbi:MAG: DUF2459 domain-containing protein [Burkholderiaceae bacterium]|nr:DUF2459 domain-containing protein [Burkholderiaceae bacterium]